MNYSIFFSKHDQQTKENWKLLVKGELEQCEDLLEHLEKIGYSTKSVPFQTELEQTILEEYKTSLLPVKPNLSGEFGSILVHHQKRLGTYKESEENVNLVPNLLDADSDFLDSLGTVSPYSGTTEINASRNKKYLKNMTVEEFRGKFFREMKSKAKKGQPQAKEYFQWLKTEKSLIENQEIAQIGLENSDTNQSETELNSENFAKIQKYAPKSDMPQESKIVKLKSNFSEHIMEKIEIPKHKVKKGATYQVGDCFYDENGDFMHRIPGI